jgi:hypothetical protein
VLCDGFLLVQQHIRSSLLASPDHTYHTNSYRQC